MHGNESLCKFKGISSSAPMDPNGVKLSPPGRGCNNNNTQWSSH